MLTVKHINAQIVLGLLDLDLFQTLHPELPKRALEKAGSQHVLKSILNNPSAEINYTAEGKPFMQGRPEFISISHSHRYLCLIMHQQQSIGVDIELIRDKVKLIKHKFLNISEDKAAGNNTEMLIRYWAAKETLYKLYGMKGLDFIENLHVRDFEENKIIGKITKDHCNQSFMLQWEKLGNYILVYSLHEI